MRVVALHADVVVVTLAACGRRRARSCAPARRRSSIDSPVLPRRARGRCRRCSSRRASRVGGLLATHADWDHLLGAARLPGRAARRAPRRPRRGCAASPGAAQRELREFDEEHYVERAPPLSLRAGPGAAGARAAGARRATELELHPADGHTADGMAVWVAVGAACSSCGDYLSPVEIPMISPGGSRDAYLRDARAAGARSSSRPTWVVPGHGAPIDAPARWRSCARTCAT